MKNNRYFFFYKSKDPFSNWYPCEFIDNESVVYNCSEQYMMAKKALLFNDYETYDKIMLAKTPKEQKRLGRLVKGFNWNIWKNYARNIVYDGCKLKFEQNPELLKLLLSTEDKILAEASPTDLIWGIGFDEYNPNRFDQSKWTGENWLGEVLMKLRTDFKK